MRGSLYSWNQLDDNMTLDIFYLGCISLSHFMIFSGKWKIWKADSLFAVHGVMNFVPRNIVYKTAEIVCTKENAKFPYGFPSNIQSKNF